jgi:flagellar biosynthesis protein FliP
VIHAIRKPYSICGLAILIFLGSHPEAATAANNDLVIVSGVANDAGGVDYSLSLQVLLIMTALTLLPATIMAVTSFTRIIVVLAILRQALGLMQTPSNQTLLGLALFLSIFIMSPVLDPAWSNGIQPYLDEEIDFNSAYEETVEPFRDFMLAQVRENDIVFFSELRGLPVPADASEISMIVLVPAFMTSELKTAFQIGFMLFIPFLVIDLVVSSVLMSMGMMMLSPMLISLPFKIMLFVLVDGWTLVLGTLAESFSN